MTIDSSRLNASQNAQPDLIAPMRLDEDLYAKHLAKVGYDNYYIGKWHCGVNKTGQDYGLKGWSLRGSRMNNRSAGLNNEQVLMGP